MSHNSYIGKYYGDNCFGFGDNNRKQMWRYHNRNEINIFVNNGYQACHTSHCGKKLGFWGGVGLAAGQWFFGGLSSLGNSFSGGFNLWGGGLNLWGNNSFGGWNPWGNSGGGPFSGDWWNKKASSKECSCDGCGNKKKTESRKDKEDKDPKVSTDPKEGVKLTDKDYGSFNDLAKKILDANWESLTSETIKGWKAELEKLVDTDDVNKAENEKQKANIDDLIKKAEAHQKLVEQNNNLKAKNELTPEKIDEMLKKTPLEAKDLEAIRALLNNNEVIPGDRGPKIIEKLEASLQGLKINDDEYKITKDYTNLLALEILCKFKPNTVVYVETRNASTDQWIKGSISGVQESDEYGKTSYWVNCKDDSDASIKASWKFTQLDDGNAEITGTTCDPDETDEYNAHIGMQYTWDEEQQCYINENGKATGNKVKKT